MKPSELKKNGNFSGRINKDIEKLLKKKGITAQHIVDAYIDTLLKIDFGIKWKKGPK